MSVSLILSILTGTDARMVDIARLTADGPDGSATIVVLDEQYEAQVTSLLRGGVGWFREQRKVLPAEGATFFQAVRDNYARSTYVWTRDEDPLDE